MSGSDRVDPRWPALVLSARPFLGTSSVSKQADLDCAVRFSKPENSASVVIGAVQRGAGAVAPMNDANLLRALDLARERSDFQVYPIIPNVIGYVRDATDHGMVGAGIKHVRRLGVGDLLAVGLRGVANLRGVLTRDFPAMLSVLIEVEMAAFKKFRPPLVLLHGQLADIALALGNKQAFALFADVIRRRFGAEPGVVTNNLATMLQALTDWNVDIRVVVAPFNSRGFLMKPTRQACEALARTTDRYLIADRIATGGPLNGDFDYLRGLEIRSAMVEIIDPVAVDSIVASRSHVGQERAVHAG